MNEYNKILAVVLTIVMVPVISIVLTSIATVKATDTTVTRIVSTTNPTPSSTFDVTLNITGLQVGGIVETIPDGFSFVNTAHPSNQTYVSGHKVVFVVINETSIEYKVRAPPDGSGTFSGTWYDALNEKEGNSGSTSVSVSSAGTPTPSPTGPGFEVVFALTGLLVALFLFSRRGRRR